MASEEPTPPPPQPPLLPSILSSDDSATTSANHGDPDEYTPVSFLHGRRPLRDLPSLTLFLLLSLSSFAVGIFAVAHRNRRSSASTCAPPPALSSLVLSLPSSSKSFITALVSTLVLTAFLSLPIAFSLLWLLRRHPKQIVYAALPLFALLPAFLNVYWFVACALGSSCRAAFPLTYRVLVLGCVFLLIAIVVWIIVVNWHRIELTARIICVAAKALAGCLGLFLVLPLMALGAAIYVAPIVVFLVFAPGNGEVVAREKEGGGYYCKWKQDGWVNWYFALGIITILWTLATLIEAQVYVISGTVAQWYFAKEGEKPAKSIRASLGHVFGPSLGTLCFSGMAMGVVRIIRALIDAAEREDGGFGIVNYILRRCAYGLLSAINFVNKFALNFAAITGESYCSSAKMTYELLKRNLLSAVFVETVSTRILVGLTFVISTIYAIAVCAVLKAVTTLEADVYLVVFLPWALLVVVLGFFVHVLDNAIDAVYICYAIDRDKGEVTKREVHEVYAHLPICRVGSGRPSHGIRRPLLV